MPCYDGRVPAHCWFITAYLYGYNVTNITCILLHAHALNGYKFWMELATILCDLLLKAIIIKNHTSNFTYVTFCCLRPLLSTLCCIVSQMWNSAAKLKKNVRGVGIRISSYIFHKVSLYMKFYPNIWNLLWLNYQNCKCCINALWIIIVLHLIHLLIQNACQIYEKQEFSDIIFLIRASSYQICPKQRVYLVDTLEFTGNALTNTSILLDSTWKTIDICLFFTKQLRDFIASPKRGKCVCNCYFFFLQSHSMIISFGLRQSYDSQQINPGPLFTKR